MVIEINSEILKQYGSVVAVLHGYIKSKVSDGIEIGGVKCSPIKIEEMASDLGGLMRPTVYKHLATLSENGYIVSSSKILPSPLECDLDKKIRTSRGHVFFGIVKG